MEGCGKRKKGATAPRETHPCFVKARIGFTPKKTRMLRDGKSRKQKGRGRALLAEGTPPGWKTAKNLARRDCSAGGHGSYLKGVSRGVNFKVGVLKKKKIKNAPEKGNAPLSQLEMHKRGEKSGTNGEEAMELRRRTRSQPRKGGIKKKKTSGNISL